MKGMSFFCLVLLVLFYFDTNQCIDVSEFEQRYKTIEVKGEVKTPGVYEVDWNATAAQVIKKAGGLSEDADTSRLNLTKNLEHHAVLVIAQKQEEPLISINTATLEQLDTLKGVGPSIAQRIVDYRSQHPFQSLEELKEVKGIGDKMYDKIKDFLCL